MKFDFLKNYFITIYPLTATMGIYISSDIQCYTCLLTYIWNVISYGLEKYYEYETEWYQAY